MSAAVDLWLAARVVLDSAATESARDLGVLRTALGESAARFREYERLHMEKEPPDTLKAGRNRDMALMCERALKRADQ